MTKIIRIVRCGSAWWLCHEDGNVRVPTAFDRSSNVGAVAESVAREYPRATIVTEQGAEIPQLVQ